MSLLNCEIYQRGRVSRVADTELVLLIAHLSPTSRFNSWLLDKLGAIKQNKLLKKLDCFQAFLFQGSFPIPGVSTNSEYHE